VAKRWPNSRLQGYVHEASTYEEYEIEYEERSAEIEALKNVRVSRNVCNCHQSQEGYSIWPRITLKVLENNTRKEKGRAYRQF
jgi:hypothetical protein